MMPYTTEGYEEPSLISPVMACCLPPVLNPSQYLSV
jgi:hypothetical protein